MRRTRRLLEVFNVLTLVGGIVILLTLAYEVVNVDMTFNSPLFRNIQLGVCLVFLTDFFLGLRLAEHKGRYWLSNSVLFLVSIPYLTITALFDLPVSVPWYLVLRGAPLLRGVYALFVVIRWITRSRIGSLLLAYLITVIGLTFFASLVFFQFELGTNPAVHNFGDAFWWAWMNVTTVGSNIFAVTTVGKFLSVMLAASGMMLFPIFTAYVINRFKDQRASHR